MNGPALDSQGRLGPSAPSVAPSAVAGLTETEFELLAEEILYWSSRSLGERLRAAVRHARHERLLQRLAEQNRGG